MSDVMHQTAQEILQQKRGEISDQDAAGLSDSKDIISILRECRSMSSLDIVEKLVHSTRKCPRRCWGGTNRRGIDRADDVRSLCGF